MSIDFDHLCDSLLNAKFSVYVRQELQEGNKSRALGKAFGLNQAIGCSQAGEKITQIIKQLLVSYTVKGRACPSKHLLIEEFRSRFVLVVQWLVKVRGRDMEENLRTLHKTAMFIERFFSFIPEFHSAVFAEDKEVAKEGFSYYFEMKELLEKEKLLPNIVKEHWKMIIQDATQKPKYLLNWLLGACLTEDRDRAFEIAEILREQRLLEPGCFRENITLSIKRPKESIFTSASRKVNLVFLKMCAPKIAEAVSSALAIEDSDPKAFAAVIDWIYARSMDILTNDNFSDVVRIVDQYSVSELLDVCRSVCCESQFLSAKNLDAVAGCSSLEGKVDAMTKAMIEKRGKLGLDHLENWRAKVKVLDLQKINVGLTEVRAIATNCSQLKELYLSSRFDEAQLSSIFKDRDEIRVYRGGWIVNPFRKGTELALSSKKKTATENRRSIRTERKERIPERRTWGNHNGSSHNPFASTQPLFDESDKDEQTPQLPTHEERLRVQDDTLDEIATQLRYMREDWNRLNEMQDEFNRGISSGDEPLEGLEQRLNRLSVLSSRLTEQEKSINEESMHRANEILLQRARDEEALGEPVQLQELQLDHLKGDLDQLSSVLGNH